MDPQDTFALSNMGTSLLNQGKYDQAISFLKRGLEIRPDHCEMIYDLAVAVTKKGEYEEAMGLCERGVSVNPHSTFLHNWMGYLYFIQGKYKDAILKFDRGIQTFPGYEMSYFNKTLVLFCQKDMEEEEVKKAFESGIQMIKKRSQKMRFLKMSVGHYNSEMNRIGKELERDDFGFEARVHFEKIYKGLGYLLNLLEIEGEKLAN